MKKLLLISCLLTSCTLIAQDNPMAVFDNLVGSTWVSEGKQLGGFDGKTEAVFSWGLDQKIVHVKTYTTDPQTKDFGLRNEGVRAFDAAKERIAFYEFDKFGGITAGIVIADSKNLHYEYDYQGLTLRDSWIYVSEDEYQFIVGTWENGDWTKKFHEARFSRLKK
ncbi:MAG: hypothetical protein HRU41_24800 [Saprospiraceae bacterium]|nr:hypothetical protein [Saprospiraceae bacterium]